jgi:hypothetical protein
MSAQVTLHIEDRHTHRLEIDDQPISFGTTPFCDVYWDPKDLGSRLESSPDPKPSVELFFQAGELVAEFPHNGSAPRIVRQQGDAAAHPDGTYTLEENDKLLFDKPRQDYLTVDAIHPDSALEPIPLKAPGHVELTAKTAHASTQLSNELAESPQPRGLLKYTTLITNRFLPIEPIGARLVILRDNQKRADNFHFDIESLRPKQGRPPLTFTHIDGRLEAEHKTRPNFGPVSRGVLDSLRAGHRAIIQRGERSFLYVPILDQSGLKAGIGVEYNAKDIDPINASHEDNLEQVYAALSTVSNYVTDIYNSRLRRQHLENRINADANSHQNTLEGQLPESSRNIQRLDDQLRSWSTPNTPVLIFGEPGTIKERLGRRLHQMSERKGEPFSTLDCSQFDDESLALELFGGPSATPTATGLLEIADGGTVLLKRIDTMPLYLQAKLLRTLQSGDVRPEGATFGRPVDLRVVASTHRDLLTLVNRGDFRDDLHAALKEQTVWLPPLRNRPEDIEPVARAFLDIYAGRHSRSCTRLSDEATSLLSNYHWPGNTRQLETVVESSVLGADKNADELRPKHLNLGEYRA